MARPVSDEDLQAAALFTLDAVANIVAGRNSVQGRKLLAWQNAMSEGSPNRAIDKARLSFLYGSLCHILEVDDLHRASVVHPGCRCGARRVRDGARQRRQDSPDRHPERI